jgi:hypothetical protein
MGLTHMKIKELLDEGRAHACDGVGPDHVCVKIAVIAELQAKTIDVKREKVTAPSPDNVSWTTPEELTTSILYLLSDEASIVNGAKIPIYGSY